jgi:hypothetical protein
MSPLALKLIAALDAAGIKWRDYSGRGMYGSYCVGVTCGRDTYEREVIEAVAEIPEAASPNYDSMGLGTILYWPAAIIDPRRY